MRENRAKELFLAALEVADADRLAWLTEQCDGDRDLFNEVQSLLDHDTPKMDDRLAWRLDSALLDPPRMSTFDHTEEHGDAGADVTVIDSAHFLARLSEAGVIPQDQIEELNRAVSKGERTNPRHLACQLVKDGKLTEYQASALLKGQPELLIDKYLILDLLDAGGMGMVFKAIHRPMNRVVAIKMIAQHLLASPEQVKRFQREVRVAATLEHPNIVRAYDADQSKGVHFLVMEYVRGDNVTRLVQREGPLPVEQAVNCIRQAATGLRYAQKHGVIHRDIKPGNLMLTEEGLTKILDLGLANVDESFRLAQRSAITTDPHDSPERSLAESELTSPGAVLGTVSFMAPEQSLDAHTADTRADIYSLGCTLYYLLIGEAPYKGDTIFKVFLQHRDGDVPRLRDKRPDVPDSLEAVCRKMLAKAPEDRYDSMGELLAAIEDCDVAVPREDKRSTPSTSAVADPIRSSHAKIVDRAESRSASLAAVAAVAVLVVLSVLGGGYWWTQQAAGKKNGGVPIVDPTSFGKRDDLQTVSAADLLATGEWEWRIVERLAEPINSPSPEQSAEMTADGLTIIFNSWRKSGRFGASDLWIATRETVGAPWSDPINLGKEINTEANEFAPTLSPDRLTLLFTRYNDPSGNEIFVSTRRSLSDGWTTAEPFSLQASYTPDITSDRRSAILVQSRNQRIEFAQRDAVDTKWHTATALPAEFTLGNDLIRASLSGDGRLMILAEANYISRPLMDKSWTLFYLIRDDVDSEWSKPRRIDWDNHMGAEPRLLPDGKSFIFSSANRSTPGAESDADLYLARLVRKHRNSDGLSRNNIGVHAENRRLKVNEEGQQSAADLLTTGEWEWRVKERIPERVNSTRYEFGADMTDDGLTMIYSGAVAEKRYADLFVVERPTTDAAWSQPMSLGDVINSDDYLESQPDVSSDGKTLTFQRWSDDGRMHSVYMARKSQDGEWSDPQVHELDTSIWQADFSTTRDALAMVLTQHVDSRTPSNRMGLWFSRRSTADGPWGQPRQFPDEINMFPGVCCATLSGDGRLLIFVRMGDTNQDNDLWMSTRDGWNTAWRKPVPITSLNSDKFDGAPKLVMNDQRLIFSSQFKNSQDLFIAELVRKNSDPRADSGSDLKHD